MAEFPPKNCLLIPSMKKYACQKAVCMDKRVLLMWDYEVLTPYVATIPKENFPIMLLNQY